MTDFTFETGAETHVGLVRSLNEDGFLAVPKSGLWLVADGMGGHARGDAASAAIVDRMGTLGVPSSAPDLQGRFFDRLSLANADIRAQSEAIGETMGATVAALLIHAGHFAAVWAGDSRIYLWRDGTMRRVSKDHSEVQELVDAGALSEAEAMNWPGRNVITRAIGIEDDVAAMIETRAGSVKDGDVFMVCSDGLTNEVPEDAIGRAVLGRRPVEACRTLVELALEHGAKDNVTVVVVGCRAAKEEAS